VKEMPFTEKELERCTVRKGDLLVCEGGDCGRSAIWYYDEEVCIQNHVHRLRPYVEISIEYFYHLFYLYKFTGKLRGRGVGIQGLSNEAIHQVICPLPPLAEQKRIVAKIEELLPLIDRYEQAWSKLEDFNKRFPVDMQKSILQMAIQGKLVEQRDEEGTGEELLKILHAEKDKIVQSGVLKGRKTKPLQKVSADDIPFEIPDTWCWIRLGNVAEIFGRIGFRGYTKNDIVPAGEGAITISPSNIRPNGKTDFSDCTYLSWEKYEESPEIKVLEGYILLVKTGSSYGKCGIVCDLPEKATINPQLAILKYVTCDVTYLDYALKSPMARSQFESFVIGTSIPTFSQEKLANLLLPLPPLAEQKRIVAKLEEILPLCERLK
jgi:type I restriction enzyme S subunit